MASQCLTLCVTEKEFHAALNYLCCDKENRPKWINDGANATTHFLEADDNEVIIVCIKDYENVDPIQICGLLVHEAVHVWQNYCRSIGEREPSSEFEAYSIQRISQQLIESFKDKVCKQS